MVFRLHNLWFNCKRKLANSSVTIGSDAVALGGTQTDINGLTSLDVDNLTLDGNTVSSTNTNGNIVLDPNGTGTVDVSSAKITSVATPSSDSDSATKGYVDGVVNGLDVKKSVDFVNCKCQWYIQQRCGTITASSNGALSMDGGSPSNGQRVLLKNQTSNVQNGIYVVTNSGGVEVNMFLQEQQTQMHQKLLVVHSSSLNKVLQTQITVLSQHTMEHRH